MITSLRRIAHMIIGILVMVVMSSAAAAQESKSVALAKELGQVMDAKKMTTIAAKDGADPEAFVAAMYFTGSQLLVVSAKYAPAVLLNEKLTLAAYQDIYIDLNSAAKAGTKVFFEDAGADGLTPDHQENKAFDSMDTASKRTLFDDHWRKDQKLSEQEYAKVFADADKVYTRLLQALLAQAKK